MASRRTKSVGTKMTPEEYTRIQTLAGEQPISEWVRATLLKAADPPAPDAALLAETVLAEVLALRAILLNLHFHLCSGAAVTAETRKVLSLSLLLTLPLSRFAFQALVGLVSLVVLDQ